MRNIVLICSAGMSTSMLVTKMSAYAMEIGYECNINAYGLADAPNVIPSADIVLLGPQIRFNQKKLAERYPDKPVECIEMRMYGTMDGKGVINFVKTKLNDE